MQPSEPCPERKRLLDEWHIATLDLSRLIAELRETTGFLQKSDYQALLMRTDQARLAAESARLQLDFHRTEHGC